MEKSNYKQMDDKISDLFLINILTLNVRKSKFINFHTHQSKTANNDQLENVKHEYEL